MVILGYCALNERLVRHVTVVRRRYDHVLQRWRRVEPGPHVVYGGTLYLVYPMERMERDGSDSDIEQLRHILGQSEEMATSTDGDMRGVPTATVCCYLTGRPQLYERAEPHMRSGTRELCRTTEP